MEDEQVLKDRNDIEMMKRPHLWPMGRLPLKRQHPEDDYRMQTALAYPPDADGAMVIIVNGNLFGGHGDEVTENYIDAEGVSDAGWRVD